MQAVCSGTGGGGGITSGGTRQSGRPGPGQGQGKRKRQGERQGQGTVDAGLWSG